jgi:hypothetical protein
MPLAVKGENGSNVWNPSQPARKRAPEFFRRSGPVRVRNSRDLLPWLDWNPHFGSGGASWVRRGLLVSPLKAPAQVGAFFFWLPPGPNLHTHAAA